MRFFPGGRVVKIHVQFLRRAMNSANMAALQIGMSKASRADFGSKYGEMVREKILGLKTPSFDLVVM